MNFQSTGQERPLTDTFPRPRIAIVVVFSSSGVKKVVFCDVSNRVQQAGGSLSDARGSKPQMTNYDIARNLMREAFFAT